MNTGRFKITYSTIGYMNFVEQVEACAGQILTLSDVVLVKSNLAQGRVQVVMQWKYVCADGNATYWVECANCSDPKPTTNGTLVYGMEIASTLMFKVPRRAVL